MRPAAADVDASIRIHLVTVIGSEVKLLGHMLRHYRQMGIGSFLINAHLRYRDDPIMREIEWFTDEFGCSLTSISIGEWSDELNTQIYSASRKHRRESTEARKFDAMTIRRVVVVFSLDFGRGPKASWRR